MDICSPIVRENIRRYSLMFEISKKTQDRITTIIVTIIVAFLLYVLQNPMILQRLTPDQELIAMILIVIGVIANAITPEMRANAAKIVGYMNGKEDTIETITQTQVAPATEVIVNPELAEDSV